MRLKFLTRVFLLLILSSVFTSCSTQKSNRSFLGFEKRKHRPGFHHSLFSQKKAANDPKHKTKGKSNQSGFDKKQNRSPKKEQDVISQITPIKPDPSSIYPLETNIENGLSLTTNSVYTPNHDFNQTNPAFENSQKQINPAEKTEIEDPIDKKRTSEQKNRYFTALAAFILSLTPILFTMMLGIAYFTQGSLSVFFGFSVLFILLSLLLLLPTGIIMGAVIHSELDKNKQEWGKGWALAAMITGAATVAGLLIIPPIAIIFF